MTADYTADGKFLTVPTFRGEKQVVPVSFVDEILERGLSGREIEDLLFWRRLTKDASSVEKVRIADLEGVDLKGKTCYIYFPNWEDSEWMSTSAAVTVVAPTHEAGTYRFLMNERQEKAWNDELELEDNEIFEQLLHVYFNASSEVIVLTY